MVLGALYLAWLLASRVAWSDLAERLRLARRVFVALALLCLVARFTAAHLRWSLALGKVGVQASPGLRLLSLASAILINHVTPTARLLGGVVRARYVRQRVAVPFSRLYATVLADQLSHHTSHAVVTWVALAIAAWQLGRYGVAVLVAASLPALLIVATLWSRWRREPRNSNLFIRLIRRSAERHQRRLGALVAGGRSLLDRLRDIFADRSLLGRMAGLSVAHLTLNAAAQWLLFTALGEEIPFPTVIAALALGTGAGLLSGTPGGIGATEAAMVGCYVLLGVDQVAAAAATLLYRSLHYALVLALGIPSFIYLEASRRGVATQRREED